MGVGDLGGTAAGLARDAQCEARRLADGDVVVPAPLTAVHAATSVCVRIGVALERSTHVAPPSLLTIELPCSAIAPALCASRCQVPAMTRGKVSAPRRRRSADHGAAVEVDRAVWPGHVDRLWRERLAETVHEGRHRATGDSVRRAVVAAAPQCNPRFLIHSTLLQKKSPGRRRRSLRRSCAEAGALDREARTGRVAGVRDWCGDDGRSGHCSPPRVRMRCRTSADRAVVPKDCGWTICSEELAAALVKVALPPPAADRHERPAAARPRGEVDRGRAADETSVRRRCRCESRHRADPGGARRRRCARHGRSNERAGGKAGYEPVRRRPFAGNQRRDRRRLAHTRGDPWDRSRRAPLGERRHDRDRRAQPIHEGGHRAPLHGVVGAIDARAATQRDVRLRSHSTFGQ